MSIMRVCPTCGHRRRVAPDTKCHGGHGGPNSKHEPIKMIPDDGTQAKLIDVAPQNRTLVRDDY